MREHPHFNVDLFMMFDHMTDIKLHWNIYSLINSKNFEFQTMRYTMKNSIYLVTAVTTFTMLASNVNAQSYVNSNNQNFNYDYAEIGYFDGELDVIDDANDFDADGLSVRGAYRLKGDNQNIFLHGGYSDFDIDENQGGDVSELRFGAGYISEQASGNDLLATLTYIRQDFDPDNGSSDDESGFGLAAGVRNQFNQDVELRATFNFESVDDSYFYLELEGDYRFDQNLAAGLSVFLGDVSGFALRGRYYFNQ